MNLNEIRERLEKVLPAKRFRHTLGVEGTAKALALHYGVDINKASLAGLLHDCAKGLPEKDLLKKAENFGIIKDKFERQIPDLLHGPVGAKLAQEEFGVNDPDVLRAIEVHTTGAEEMTLLDKVVYIADYIEPNRDFSGVEKLREAAWVDLDWCMILAINQTIFYLIGEDKLIHPTTILVRNAFLSKGHHAREEKINGRSVKQKAEEEG